MSRRTAVELSVISDEPLLRAKYDALMKLPLLDRPSVNDTWSKIIDGLEQKSKAVSA